MPRRISFMIDGDLETKFEEYRDKLYPKLQRSVSLEMLVTTALYDLPPHNYVTAQRALIKAEQMINYAKEIVHVERIRLEPEPTLPLQSPTQTNEETSYG